MKKKELRKGNWLATLIWYIKWFSTREVCKRQDDRNSIKVSTWKKIPFPDENSIYTKMT